MAAEEKIKKIFDKLEKYYPEHKVFAFNSINKTLQENMSSLYKILGYESMESFLGEYGYEMISGEEVRKLRNTVIYTPGNEPEIVKSKVESILKRLEEAYPDKKINGGMQKDHKSLSGDISGMYQWLGYESNNAFLAAYGYEKTDDEVGRKAGDYMAIIEEVKRRAGDVPYESLKELKEKNPDIEPRIKTIINKSNELFGMTFKSYLIKEGLIKGEIEDKDEYARKLATTIEMLKEKYKDGNKPSSITELFYENPDLDRGELAKWYRKLYKNTKLKEYLETVGVIATEEEKQMILLQKLETLTEELKKRYPEEKYAKSLSDVIYNNVDLDVKDIHNLVRQVYGNTKTAVQYLKENKIIRPDMTAKEEFEYYMRILRERYASKCVISYKDLKTENPDIPFSRIDKYTRNKFHKTANIYLEEQEIITRIGYEELSSPVAGETEDCGNSPMHQWRNIVREYVTRINWYGKNTYNPKTKTAMITEEVKGTMYDGRDFYVKKLKKNEQIFIEREPDNSYNTLNLKVVNKNGNCLGNMPKELCNMLSPLIDSGYIKILSAKVQNDSCSLGYLTVSFKVKFENKAQSNVYILHFGESPERMVQKVHILNTNISMDDAKKMFEICREIPKGTSIVKYVREQASTILSHDTYEKISSMDETYWKYQLLEIFEQFAVSEEEYYWEQEWEIDFEQWDYLARIGFEDWKDEIAISQSKRDYKNKETLVDIIEM